MGATLTVRDETVGARTGNREFALEIPSARLTVRELIRARVYGEVAEYNAALPDHFRGLVRPTDAEETLNGFRLRRPKRIDAESQFERAMEAFGHNGFMLLVDDRQVEEPEQVVEVRPETTVTFLKLVPLVGG